MSKKLFDNSNLQQEIEWGNVPVGNMTDEELHGTNWLRIAARQEQSNDPEFCKRHLAGIEKRNSSIEFIESIKQRQVDPTYRQKYTEGMSKRNIDYSFRNTDEYKQAHVAGMQKLKENSTYIDVRKKVGKQNAKQIQTPDGIFESRKLAAKHYKVDPAMISFRLKRYPDQYYYIEKKSDL